MVTPIACDSVPTSEAEANNADVALSVHLALDGVPGLDMETAEELAPEYREVAVRVRVEARA